MKSKSNAALQTLRGEVNRQTAGQQTNRVEDRRLEDLARCRPRHTFSQVKEICDDENRKDRRLSDDETGHRHLPTRWQTPLGRRVRKYRCHCAHMISPSLITAIGIFRMLLVPERAAACHG